MSRTQQILGIGIVVVFALGLGYAGWRMMSPSQGTSCQASERKIHADMRTVAFVGDKRGVYCCPSARSPTVLRVHNRFDLSKWPTYETGRPLRPADAFAVEGSDVIPCIRRTDAQSDGQPVPEDFDRCSPSIIAVRETGRGGAIRLRTRWRDWEVSRDRDPAAGEPATLTGPVSTDHFVIRLQTV